MKQPHRNDGMIVWRMIRRYVVAGLLLGYTVLVIYWMFWGFGRTAPNADTPYRYNVLPLHTIIDFATMRAGSQMDRWINLLGNVLVFVPFGLSIPFVFKVRWHCFMYGFAGSILLLETMQLLTRRGTLDVDDIVLNTAGAGAGYALSRLGMRWRR